MTVVAARDRPESVAVTVAVPPFSEIDDGDAASVTPGALSSSAIVSVLPAGSATPLPPAAAPETVTDLSGSWVAAASPASFSAVTVTVPALVVEPAAMVSVLAVLSAKSPAIVSPPAAAAVTVTVTAALDLPDSRAVTVETPPFSEIASGDDGSGSDSSSVTTGSASSSSMVTVTSRGFAAPEPPDTRPETTTSLSGASTSLLCGMTATCPVLVVAPAAMVSVLPAW